MAKAINDLSNIYLPSSTDKGVGFHIHKSKDGQFYFHFTSKNGNILVVSEMYKRKASATKGIKSLVKLIKDGFGDIDDRSK